MLGAALLSGTYVALSRDEAGPPAEPHAPSACKPITFDGKRFTECIAVPGRHRITTKITGKNGVIYRGFAGLAEDVDPATVAFAVNGGMYDTGSEPIGYYAEDGERLYPLNSRDGGGNFYLKPNGVFFGAADGDWRVMTSDDFAARVVQRPNFGTQSGPMLLLDGKLHPRISPDGTSRKIRNAVGVDAEGRAHFVISDEPVSFGTLAALMRDHAGTRDALFLDGTVSALWDPATGRIDGLYPLGPLILVTHRSRD
ncbi:hypothetical protein EAO27_10520 [Sphingopyxis sp. YF1]|nr:hypothetical protein EAO27_10520 [Sphingopyxis sp. YF1]